LAQAIALLPSNRVAFGFKFQLRHRLVVEFMLCFIQSFLAYFLCHV